MHYRGVSSVYSEATLQKEAVPVIVLVLVLVLQIGNVHQRFCLLDQSPPAAVASDFAKSVLITSAL